MKTIITTLPIYDKLAKQVYQRATHVNSKDLPDSGHGIVPIITPRHRLPSFQWKDGTDGAATVSKMELIDKDGGSLYVNMGAGSWENGIVGTMLFSTLTTSYLNITNAIANTDSAAKIVQTFNRLTGDVIQIKGVFAKTSGAASVAISFYGPGYGVPRQTTWLTPGLNTITFTYTLDEEIIIAISTNGSCTFSFTDVSVGINNITHLFPTALTPFAITGDVYFQYKGETLNYLLPTGEYYLKITMDTGHVYYSEWFLVTCVYENLITLWENLDYNTFASSGTAITSMIETATSGDAKSNSFSVIKGEVINVKFFLTHISGAYPLMILKSLTDNISNGVALVAGLNEVTLTVTATDTAWVWLVNDTAANNSMTEVLVQRSYSEKYLTLNFHNDCDLGDILYHDGFTQTFWFESETMEPSFPNEEEGQKNGEGRFLRTFARQTKKYLARTKEMPDFMVDVFNRLKLHDSVVLTDLVGDVNSLYNLEVEHEWLFDDKYYAKIDLTFDYDETVIVSGCCSNIP